jgi:YVTN family beta-propeller protein
VLTTKTTALVGSVLTLVGCLTPVDPAESAISEVRVSFDASASVDTIGLREITRARAAAISRTGFDLGRTDFAYATSDANVAIVDAAGIVRPVSPGTATIRASLPGGHAGEGTVVVLPSSVRYSIPVGTSPGSLAFSPDYTRLYVGLAADSLAVVDAIGFFRLQTIAIGLPARSVAATSQSVFATHVEADSVSVIDAATSRLVRRIHVGDGPAGIAATATRVFVALQHDRRIAVVAGDAIAGYINVDGAPVDVAVARDGRRVFATIETPTGWKLAVAAGAPGDAFAAVTLSSRPTSVATDASGTRVYILLPDEARAVVITEGSDGHYEVSGTVAVSADAGGISGRLTGDPLAVVSGAPTTLFDGITRSVSERIEGVGSGGVAVRPDGLFAFVADRANGVLRVVGL